MEFCISNESEKIFEYNYVKIEYGFYKIQIGWCDHFVKIGKEKNSNQERKLKKSC